jgi:hypothetical protein
MPLHHQEAHGRRIIVDYHPGLHLLWYYEQVFIKPIPAYFYESSLWEYLMQPGDERSKLLKACLGFMRSWSFLVQYELDFDLACEKKLIPKRADKTFPTYKEFCDFLEAFAHVGDKEVNLRYQYGELRLTRINRTAVPAAGKMAYFHLHPQWGSVLAHMLAPVITIFAVFSVALEAMQVQLNAQQIFGGSPGPSNDTSSSTSADNSDTSSTNWVAFNSVSLYFPIVVLTVIAAILGATVLGFTLMAVKDLLWAKSVRVKKKHNKPRAGEKSHGMIW